jgi:hypothetical protein
MLFPCPSPSGRNDAGLYLDRGGNLVDKHGALWGRRGTMAMDSLPDGMSPSGTTAPSGREKEALEQLKKLRNGVEKLLEKLDLSDEVCHEFYNLLGVTKPRSLRDVGPNAERGAKDSRRGRARDEEPDHEGLVKFLRSRGLDEQSINRVLEIARAAAAEEEEAEDKLPSNALHSGRSRDDVESFERRYPEAARIRTAVPGHLQFEGAHDHRSTRRTRELAADAASDAAGLRLAKKFPGIERIGVGLFDSRR